MESGKKELPIIIIITISMGGWGTVWVVEISRIQDVNHACSRNFREYIVGQSQLYFTKQYTWGQIYLTKQHSQISVNLV